MPWAAAAAAAAAIGGAAIQSDSARSAANKQTAAANQATAAELAQFNQTRADTAGYRDLGNAAVQKLSGLLGLNTISGPVGQDYSGSLIDLSGGTPAPIASLYQSDPGYRKAWDDYKAAHDAWAIKQGGAAGYTNASDPTVIEREVRSRLPQQGAQPGAPGASGPSISDIMALDPGYQFRLDQGSKAVTNAAGASGMRNSGATLKALTRYGQDYASNEYGNIINRLAGAAGTGQTATNTVAGLGAGTAANIGNIYTGLGNARGASAIAQGNAYGGALNTIGNYYTQNQMLDKILASRQPSYSSSGGAYYGSDYAG